MKKFLLLFVAFFIYLSAAEVNVYSHRHYDSDKLLYERFEKLTGIKVNVIQAKANELIKRIESEGPNTSADIFLAADAGNLEQARTSNILMNGVTSPTIEKFSPKHLRGEDNSWFAITKRARIIVYSKDRVKKGEIKNYEDLESPKWKGKLLIRSSTNVYNQSLVSSMIESIGIEKTRQWVKGIAKNLARDPKGGDRDQVKGVAAGIADVAISNSYYLGLMLNSKNEKDAEVYKAISIVFPNQDNRGTHINISGVAITKYAKNKNEAVKFIDFLFSEEAQSILTNSNYEYPVRADVEPNKLLKEWGPFKEEKVNFKYYFSNVKEATKLFDEAKWK